MSETLTREQIEEWRDELADEYQTNRLAVKELTALCNMALGFLEMQPRDGFDDLVSDARAEAQKAMKKFPQPNYVISKVAEEAGEVVKAAIHCAENRETKENLRGEMKQLIAMLYRLWSEGDQVHGLSALQEPKV